MNLEKIVKGHAIQLIMNHFIALNFKVIIGTILLIQWEIRIIRKPFYFILTWRQGRISEYRKMKYVLTLITNIEKL